MLRRLLQLFIGLTLYGVSTAMFVRADLGADPWNVFHLGVANLLSMNIGVVIIAVGVLVLLAWIPLRQRPGFGTLSNVIMIGLAADVALLVIPGFESLLARSGLLVSAVILNALATALYIGAGFGAGPRDGLMTGIHARTGWPVRRIRTAIEVSVLLIGWLLGGTVGWLPYPLKTRRRTLRWRQKQLRFSRSSVHCAWWSAGQMMSPTAN